jgi:hypothetical protein
MMSGRAHIPISVLREVCVAAGRNRAFSGIDEPDNNPCKTDVADDVDDTTIACVQADRQITSTNPESWDGFGQPVPSTRSRVRGRLHQGEFIRNRSPLR